MIYISHFFPLSEELYQINGYFLLLVNALLSIFRIYAWTYKSLIFLINDIKEEAVATFSNIYFY
jgi:hypothetical protein